MNYKMSTPNLATRSHSLNDENVNLHKMIIERRERDKGE